MSDVKRFFSQINARNDAECVLASDYDALQAKHDAAMALLRECREIVQAYATGNPKYTDVDNFRQDPLGAHRMLEYIDALTNPKE
jgi:hypothetical protein